MSFTLLIKISISLKYAFNLIEKHKYTEWISLRMIEITSHKYLKLKCEFNRYRKIITVAKR